MKKIIFLLGAFFLIILFVSMYFFSGIKEYNQAVRESEKGNTKLSQDIFENLTGSSLFAQRSFHNLGNLIYNNGLQEKESEKQKQKWRESLAYYSGALALKKTQKTQDNYNFVLSKLQQLESQKQQKKDEEEEKKSEKGDNKNSSSSGSQSEEKKSGSGGTDTSSGSSSEDNKNEGNTENNPYKMDQETQVPSLSDAEKQYLESYQERLFREQGENQGSFNQKSAEVGDLFDGFFQSMGQGGEKDW